MIKEEELTRKFEAVFEVRQAVVLAEAITEAYTDLVKTSDFSELKAIVKDLAEAQKRTEQRVEELAETMDELAEAQKRTEQQVEKLALGLGETRSEVGGLSRSMSYALENEAYRALPAFLKAQYGIELSERLIRTDIGDEEINFFGRALYNGEAVLLVGETKLRLDERRRSRKEEQKVLATLDQKIAAVRTEYPKEKIVPLLVTHYARQAFAQKIRDQGVILVQSFEW